MKTVLDTHSHTIASGHAYSSINEMVLEASKKELELLCITDHGPAMNGAPNSVYFRNFKIIDKILYNVELFMGVELNILDFDGNVDLPEGTIKKLDIAIASFHPFTTKPGTKEENTRAFLKVLDNPYIQILGHIEDQNVPIDFEEVVKKAKQTNTLIELNNSSLKPTSNRLNTKENITKILDICKKEKAFITIGSDSHFHTSVGDHSYGINLIKEVNFPEELVINTNTNKFKNFVSQKR